MSETMDIKSIILDIMRAWDKEDPGYWFGYEKIQLEIKEKTGKGVSITKIKNVMKELRKETRVVLRPIYNIEKDRFAGSGYFYNPIYGIGRYLEE